MPEGQLPTADGAGSSDAPVPPKKPQRRWGIGRGKCFEDEAAFEAALAAFPAKQAAHRLLMDERKKAQKRVDEAQRDRTGRIQPSGAAKRKKQQQRRAWVQRPQLSQRFMCRPAAMPRSQRSPHPRPRPRRCRIAHPAAVPQACGETLYARQQRAPAVGCTPMISNGDAAAGRVVRRRKRPRRLFSLCEIADPL